MHRFNRNSIHNRTRYDRLYLEYIVRWDNNCRSYVKCIDCIMAYGRSTMGESELHKHKRMHSVNSKQLSGYSQFYFNPHIIGSCNGLRRHK